MKYDRRYPPPDPENWTLVKTKEGNFWRRKRGLTGKPVEPNKHFVENAALTRISSPAAARLRQELDPFLTNLFCSRLTVKMCARIRKGLKAESWPDYRLFRDLDFQPDYPIGEFMIVGPKVEKSGEVITVSVPIPDEGALKVERAPDLKGYSFELIMFMGDPVADLDLSTKSVASGRYIVGEPGEECVLSLSMPAEEWMPWMLLLRVRGYDDKNEELRHGRHGCMRLVSWGNGFGVWGLGNYVGKGKLE